MRLAFADPPYIGQAKRHYGSEAKEVNHPLLIAHLMEFDGWALSLSSPSIQQIAPLLPAGHRWGAWVKPFASFKPGVNPGFCWEPVVFWGGRTSGRDVDTVRDYVSCNITMQRGTHGVKPDTFSFWLFDFLGAEPDDEFTDIFPGSGAVGRAWEAWKNQRPLPFLRSAVP